jgi:hypothetical protein
MIKQFFPSTREEWSKHYPPDDGQPKMTREEQINATIIGLGDYGAIPVGPRSYSVLYGDLIGKPCPEYGQFAEMGFKVYPTWDDLVIKMKPWLANDEEFAKWSALEPFDRFRLMVCGLPWDDEVIGMLKHDGGAPPAPLQEKSDE